MQGMAKLCVIGAILAFLLAIIEVLFTGAIMGIPPESFSRASTNLALIGIGIALVFGKSSETTTAD